jgi:deoxyribose-phosphate aldolase
VIAATTNRSRNRSKGSVRSVRSFIKENASLKTNLERPRFTQNTKTNASEVTVKQHANFMQSMMANVAAFQSSTKKKRKVPINSIREGDKPSLVVNSFHEPILENGGI